MTPLGSREKPCGNSSAYRNGDSRSSDRESHTAAFVSFIRVAGWLEMKKKTDSIRWQLWGHTAKEKPFSRENKRQGTEPFFFCISQVTMPFFSQKAIQNRLRKKKNALLRTWSRKSRKRQKNLGVADRANRTARNCVQLSQRKRSQQRRSRHPSCSSCSSCTSCTSCTSCPSCPSCTSCSSCPSRPRATPLTIACAAQNSAFQTCLCPAKGIEFCNFLQPCLHTGDAT